MAGRKGAAAGQRQAAGGAGKSKTKKVTFAEPETQEGNQLEQDHAQVRV